MSAPFLRSNVATVCRRMCGVTWRRSGLTWPRAFSKDCCWQTQHIGSGTFSATSKGSLALARRQVPLAYLPGSQTASELGLKAYLDTLRIFNTHNNLSPRPGLPKYLEIRRSGIFNGTENGTEFNVRGGGLSPIFHSGCSLALGNGRGRHVARCKYAARQVEVEEKRGRSDPACRRVTTPQVASL